jgi:hypothetical protein
MNTVNLRPLLIRVVDLLWAPMTKENLTSLKRACMDIIANTSYVNAHNTIRGRRFDIHTYTFFESFMKSLMVISTSCAIFINSYDDMGGIDENSVLYKKYNQERSELDEMIMDILENEEESNSVLYLKDVGFTFELRRPRKAKKSVKRSRKAKKSPKRSRKAKKSVKRSRKARR